MSAGAVGLVVNARLGWQRRHPLRPEEGHAGDEEQIQPHQHQTGQQGTGIHVAHRSAQLVGQHDQHQRRGKRLCQRARCRDGAGGNRPVVAIAQHDGQRNQTHRNHGGRHHPRGGGEQGTHQNHGHAQTAPDGTEHLADGFQQVFGHAAAFQHDAHDREERDRQQSVVLHDAEHTQRQGVEQNGRKKAQFHADQAEEQAGGGQ